MKLIRLLLTILLLALGYVVSRAQETPPPTTFLQPERLLRIDMDNKVQPEYPAEAQGAGIHGMVLVFVVFDKDGRVKEVKPLSSPHESLSDAVVKAVKEWRMPAKPYQYYPVSLTWGELRFVFSLQDGKAEILEAPEDVQRRESKEGFAERMRRNQQIRQREKN